VLSQKVEYPFFSSSFSPPKGCYLFHFQLQSASSAALHQLLRRVPPTVRPPNGVELTLDVDPFNML
jgi:hypothetical protein